MPNSYKDYTGNGSTTTFSITFDYQKQSEISVTVDGVAQSGFTFPSSTQVQLSSAPAASTQVRIRRTTDLTSREVDFTSGSVLTEEDLDNSNIQVFHAVQEAVDTTSDSIALDDDDKFDAKSKIVKNVANPTSAQDAVTKDYLENTWLSTSDKAQLNSLNLTNLNTVATNIVDVNSFANTYFISGSTPSSPTAGDIWYDTSTNTVKIYNGSSFLPLGQLIGSSLKLADNEQAIFGASEDLKIYHDGNHSFILDQGTGYLYLFSDGPGVGIMSSTSETMALFTPNGAATLYYDNSAKIATTAAGIDVTGTVTDDGATHDGDVTFTGASYNAVWDKSDNALEFADNAKAVFGAGNDLQIYHDGSNSNIYEAGTGDLTIQTNGTKVGMAKASPFEWMLEANADADVKLYYDGNQKLATTSAGINVTGNVQLSGGLSVGGDLGTSGQILSSTGSGLQWITDSGGGGGGTDFEGGVVINDNSANVDFRVESNNDTHMLFVDGSADSVGIGTSAPDSALHVYKQINDRSARFQRLSTQYIDIGQTSGINEIKSTGKNLEIGTTDALDFIIDTNNAERLRIDSSGKVGLGTSSPVNKLSVNGSITLNNYYETYLANAYYDSAWKYAANGVAWGIGNNFGGVTNGTTIAVASSNSGGPGAALTWSPAFDIESSGNVTINERGADVDFRVESNGSAHMLFVDGGNDRVGIGEGAPSATLHVNKGTNAQSAFPSGDWAAKIFNQTDASTEHGLVVANRWAAASSTVFEVGGLYDNGDGFDTFFKVDGSGGVGIGGNDTGSAGLLSVYGGATGEGGEIRIHPSAAEDTTVDFWVVDVATDDLRVFNNLGDLALTTIANGSVDLYHDGGHKFSTTASGIALNGGQTSQISIKSTGGSGFTQGAIVIEGHASEGTPGNRGQGVYYFNEGNDRTYYSGTLYNNGTVWGVGTASSTSLAAAAADTTNAIFAVDGVNQRVGIKQASPSTELDVNGTVKISGGLNAGGGLGSSGQVLTSTGTGINWTNPTSAGITASNAADNRVAVFSSSTNIEGDADLTWNGLTLAVAGAISKNSGSFKIDHPLPAKSDTHHLVHSFLEGPQADLIYRGKIDLVDGSATVNINTAAGMTDGTFVALCTDVQCFTSNESGWTAVKGAVSGNTLTITAQDNTCTDTISWMVVGERKDAHMFATDWTDDNGKVIVEPLKPVI